MEGSAKTTYRYMYVFFIHVRVLQATPCALKKIGTGVLMQSLCLTSCVNATADLLQNGFYKCDKCLGL